MTKPAGEIFSSRWALILAGLGMAVGTGNLWAVKGGTKLDQVAEEN